MRKFSKISLGTRCSTIPRSIMPCRWYRQRRLLHAHRVGRADAGRLNEILLNYGGVIIMLLLRLLMGHEGV